MNLNEALHKAWTGNLKDLTNVQVEIENFFKLDFLTSAIAIGISFYHVLDLINSKIDICSDNIKEALGYEPMELDVEGFLSIIHPEDVEAFIRIQNEIRELSTEIKYTNKFCYDLRLKTKTGEYRQFYLQNYLLFPEPKIGCPRKVLTCFNDITSYKFGGEPKLEIIPINSTLDDIFRIEKVEKIQLTKRETEIFELLLTGKTSKEIADCLNISKLTVDTHRKNILKKNKVANVTELTQKFYKK